MNMAKRIFSHTTVL